MNEHELTSGHLSPDISNPKTDLERQLRGERLTTTEILYHLPDHPGVLQTFVWQTLDKAPEFPRIQRFLGFWRQEISAVIHTVWVSGLGEVDPGKLRHVGEMKLH